MILASVPSMSFAAGSLLAMVDEGQTQASPLVTRGLSGPKETARRSGSYTPDPLPDCWALRHWLGCGL